MRLRALTTILPILLITGCAGYDQWAEDTNKKIAGSYTEALLGKQTLDIDPAVPKALKVNLAYRLGEGRGMPGRGSSPFYNKLSGDLTYDKSCKAMLSLNVALFNKDGALVRTEPVLVASYQAGVKAMVEKDVITDPSMSRSSQVVRLLVKDFRCL